MGKRWTDLWILLQNSSVCASTFSAAERRAKLSQHLIHVPPHVCTRRLPYITSSLLERSKAKCCVYECYSPFPTDCDWLKTACLCVLLSCFFSHSAWLFTFGDGLITGISASLFSDTQCFCYIQQGCELEILQHSKTWNKVFVPKLIFMG